MEDKRVLRKAILIGWFLVVSNYSYAWASEFGPFQGKILDADTREPVEGVVVLIEWQQYRLSSLFENTIFYDAQETLADKNGEFYMSGIWVINPWTRLMLETNVMIYKSGYEAIRLGSWKGLLEAKSWRQPTKMRGNYILKVEDGKPVIVLKKLTDIEERRRKIPTDEPFVSDEQYHLVKKKWKLLRQEINKERRFLGLDGLIDSDGFGR